MLHRTIESHNAIKDELAEMDKAWDERTESAKVEHKKIELLGENIAEIHKKMNALVNKYYDEEDAYYVQQKEIRKIEWMMREKERALEKQAYVTQKKVEEKEKTPQHPYLEEMGVCDHLIAYCKKFGVVKKADEKKEEEKVLTKELESKISKGEITLVENKRKKEEQGFFVVNTRPKKAKQNPEQKKKDPKLKKGKKVEPKFEVDFGSLALFDKVRLQPPLLLKDLPAALEKLIERKKYYYELPLVEYQQELQAQKEAAAKLPPPESKPAEEQKKGAEEPKPVPAAAPAPAPAPVSAPVPVPVPAEEKDKAAPKAEPVEVKAQPEAPPPAVAQVETKPPS